MPFLKISHLSSGLILGIFYEQYFELKNYYKNISIIFFRHIEPIEKYTFCKPFS